MGKKWTDAFSGIILESYPGAAFREMLGSLDLMEDKAVSEKEPDGENPDGGDGE